MPAAEEEEQAGGFADMSDEEVDGFGSLSESEEDSPKKKKSGKSKSPKPVKKKPSKRAEKAMLSIAEDWNSSAAQMGATFYVRSNVQYNGDMDPDPPHIAMGIPLQFYPQDFIQVFKVVDDDWWIARVVGGGTVIGLMPSPSNFRRKYEASQAHERVRSSQEGGGVMRRMSSFLGFASAPTDGGSAAGTDANLENGDVGYKEKIQNFEMSLGKMVVNSQHDHLRGHDIAHSAFGRPNPEIDVYDNAPRTRPIVFVGPSKIGCPVTDQLQRALINYLQVVFPNTILEAPVHEWKRKGESFRGGFRPNPERKDDGSNQQEMDRTITDASEIVHPEDLKFAKKHFYDDQLTVFRIDPEDLPRIRHSSLMPCVIMVQIQDDAVLAKLIKECGEGTESLAAQIKSADTLHKMMQSEYDLVLTDANLRACCLKLQAYLDMMLGESTFNFKEDTEYPDAMAAAAAEAASSRYAERRKSKKTTGLNKDKKIVDTSRTIGEAEIF